MKDAIAQAVASIMGRHCTAEAVTRSEGSWNAALWAELADAGFTGIGIAEDHGGSGGDLGSALAAIKGAARYAAPVPLAEHLIAGGWLSEICGHPVGGGPVSSAVGGTPVPARYTAGGDACVETGFLPRVPWARFCDQVLVPLASDDGLLRVGLISQGEFAIEPGGNLAGEPRDGVRLRAVVVPAGRLVTAPGRAAEDLRLRLALARAVQMAIAIEEVLALTVRYAGERRQFGRPIGHFQAVQQSIAILAGESAAASCAAGGASAALTRRRPGSGATGAGALAVAAASMRVGTAATRACRIAHQVHGAIGFTDEHRLHQLTLRLWSWRDEPEPVSVLSERLGSRLAEIGPDRLWPAMTSEGR